MSAFWAVLRNEMTLIRRDVWYLLLMTAGAMITLGTMAYTLSAEIKHVTTLVVDLDGQHHSRRLIQALANDDFFALELAADLAEAEGRLELGTANVVVVIPDGASRALDRGETVHVQVLIDGSEPTVAELARNHIDAVVAGLAQQLAVEGLVRRGALTVLPLDFRLRIRYNPALETIVSVMPGLMACVLIVPSVGAAAAFARERERGSFEAVISTPLGRGPLLLGRICPYVLVGLFDIGIFVALGRLAFGVPLRGSLALFVLMGLLYVFATASSGILIAQFLRTQHAAAIVTFMFFGIVPTYLADIFFPVASMPAWLQWLAAAMPATHFTVIARGIFLKDVGLAALWPNALALLLTGAAMSVLAYLRFQKRLG